MTEHEKKLLGELQQLLGIAGSAIHRSWHECQIVLTDRLTEIADIQNRINQMLRASKIGDDTNAPDPPARSGEFLVDRAFKACPGLEATCKRLADGDKGEEPPDYGLLKTATKKIVCPSCGAGFKIGDEGPTP